MSLLSKSCHGLRFLVNYSIRRNRRGVSCKRRRTFSSASLYEDLNRRNLVAQHSVALPRYIEKSESSNSPLVAYCGVDPTADSLHVGHLLPLLTLRRFLRANNQSQGVLVLGTATARVGDPSGRSSERPLLSGDVVEENCAALREQLSLLFRGLNITLIENGQWIDSLSAVDFLRDLGKHVPISAMLARDSVQSRIGDGLSFAEFSYQLLQAQDFAHLLEHHGVTIQIGGSDQWGNICAGIDLVRRLHGKRVHGLTVPLLTNSAGQKIGKSTSSADGDGAPWLNSQRSSPFEFHQFFLRLSDADVIQWHLWMSDSTTEEHEQLVRQHKQEPQQRQLQESLANEMTNLVHGEELCQAVHQVRDILFYSSSSSSSLSGSLLASVMRVCTLDSIDEFESESLASLLVRAGATTSRTKAKRLLKKSPCRVNLLEEPLASHDNLSRSEHIFDNSFCLLRLGNNKSYLFEIK